MTPPAPTFSVPADWLSEALAPDKLSTWTGPLCAGATTVLPKLTLTPDGITTWATFDRSGTAPPAQFAGSNQLPETPPTQVTAFKRVMLAVVLAPVATL